MDYKSNLWYSLFIYFWQNKRRNYLWNKVRATNEEKDKRVIRSEIDSITSEIEKKRKEVRLCDGIEQRTGVLEKSIDEFEKTKGKEKEIK